MMGFSWNPDALAEGSGPELITGHDRSLARWCRRVPSASALTERKRPTREGTEALETQRESKRLSRRKLSFLSVSALKVLGWASSESSVDPIGDGAGADGEQKSSGTPACRRLADGVHPSTNPAVHSAGRSKPAGHEPPGAPSPGGLTHRGAPCHPESGGRSDA